MKQNINLHNPHWPDVVDAIGLSDHKLAIQLDRYGIDYTSSGVYQLRTRKITNPSFNVGTALLAILGEQKAINKQPSKLATSRTR
jgi:hypothetical protein